MKRCMLWWKIALMGGALLGLSLNEGAFAASASSGKGAVFTPEQRMAVVEILREALKNDPSILAGAVQSLRDKAQIQQQVQNKASIHANWPALMTAPSYAVRGNPQGAITVVEFLDPRCGYCRRMMPVVDDFLKRHSDVRLVEKILPVLGNASVLATKAIFAAALQGHYESMRQALMRDAEKVDETRLKVLVEEQGLDRERFFKDMDGPAVTGMITANLSQAQAVGLDGTPTFLFGQAVEIPGALEPEQMDHFLAEAQKH